MTCDQQNTMKSQNNEKYKLQSQHVFEPIVSKSKPLTPPHFMNHELNLREQRVQNKVYLTEKKNFPIPIQGDVPRMVGYRRAPWKDRPEG